MDRSMPECLHRTERATHHLTYIGITKGFLLATDASGAGLGAVLPQVQEDNSV